MSISPNHRPSSRTSQPNSPNWSPSRTPRRNRLQLQEYNRSPSPEQQNVIEPVGLNEGDDLGQREYNRSPSPEDVIDQVRLNGREDLEQIAQNGLDDDGNCKERNTL